MFRIEYHPRAMVFYVFYSQDDDDTKEEPDGTLSC